MAEGYERNSERICKSNSEPGRLCLSDRDFFGPEHWKIHNDELFPNDPEYNKSPFLCLPPSAYLPSNEVHQKSTNVKNFKKYGCSKQELEMVMNKYPQFNGIITSKELNRNLKEGGYLVSMDINSQHWEHVCGLMVLSNGRECFDSTGRRPQDDNSQYNEINTVQLQHDRNMTCGPHACFYLINRFQGRSMKQIIELYPSENAGSLEDNDSEVNDFFNQLLYSKRMVASN